MLHYKYSVYCFVVWSLAAAGRTLAVSRAASRFNPANSAAEHREKCCCGVRRVGTRAGVPPRPYAGRRIANRGPDWATPMAAVHRDRSTVTRPRRPASAQRCR